MISFPLYAKTLQSGESNILFLSQKVQIIEPLVSKQWFVSMEPLAEKALEAVEKGQLTIMPERFEKVSDKYYKYF